MEKNSYLADYGNRVREIRKKEKMNQTEFYDFLFPNNELQDENKKKKMNAIENGKYRHLDFAFLTMICEKCNVSCDYLFGLKNDYSNYENEFICNYTGLEEEAVIALHKWKKDYDNGADLSSIDEAFIDEENMKRANAKKAAIVFLKVINLLFKDGESIDKRDGKRKKHSNLSVLYSIYQICTGKPVQVKGTKYLDEEKGFIDKNNSILREIIDLDATKPMLLVDDSNVWYSFDAETVYGSIARSRLDNALDRMIQQVKNEMITTKKKQ